VNLRIGCDDWMKIWLNGKPVETLCHEAGFEAKVIPVQLLQGDNLLVIHLSNTDNVEWRNWAFSCVVESNQ
jgi:hypothetical protein